MQVKRIMIFRRIKVKHQPEMSESKKINLKKRSTCPISCTLDVIGDKWTALIVRDMYFFGKSRFEEFLASPEKISTNILTARLKKMEENGLIEKNQYGAHRRRMDYQLTEKGKSLAGLIKQIAVWGKKNISGTAGLVVPSPPEK